MTPYRTTGRRTAKDVASVLIEEVSVADEEYRGPSIAVSLLHDCLIRCRLSQLGLFSDPASNTTRTSSIGSRQSLVVAHINRGHMLVLRIAKFGSACMHER